MDILVTNQIALCGTAALTERFYDKLKERLPEWLLKAAQQSGSKTNPSALEIETALANGAVYAREYTKFGIEEALFQMAKELRCGLEVEIRALPIRQETVEISEVLGVNPYALYAGRSCVIVCRDGALMQDALFSRASGAVKVGCTMPGNDKMILNGTERGYLPHIREDELDRIIRETTKQ